MFQTNRPKKDLYSLLGINKNASDAEIKKAWKTCAMKHHPDRGGNKEKFQEIQLAYEVLSNQERKHKYDNFGIINENEMPNTMPTDINDLFAQMFKQQQNPNPNNKPQFQMRVININVELEEIILQKKKKINYTRTLYCEGCEGTGGDLKNKHLCSECKGACYVTKTQRNGPFMMQTNMPCGTCNSYGFTFSGTCDKCKGNKTISEKIEIEVDIPGNYSDILIKSRGDCANRNFLPGDVLIKFNILPHEKFILNKLDIIYIHSIDLYECLTGCIVNIPYFNEPIDITISEVITPNYVYTISNMGLFDVNKDNRGDLKIKFDILFPKKILPKDDNLRSKLQ